MAQMAASIAAARSISADIRPTLSKGNPTMKRLLPPALALAMLFGCASSAVTPSQVAADLTGLVATLQQMEPIVVAADPGAFTAAQKEAMANDLANAQKVLAQLSAGMPAAAGASLANEIDGYLNDAVNTIAAIAPLVPVLSSWVPTIDAIDAVLPTVEAFVNSNLPSAPTIAGIPIPSLVKARGARAVPMTPDQGRQFLGIPIVHP
jgi:hypothetical protein